MLSSLVPDELFDQEADETHNRCQNVFRVQGPDQKRNIKKGAILSKSVEYILLLRKTIEKLQGECEHLRRTSSTGDFRI